jgi:hypothetical protein
MAALSRKLSGFDAAELFADFGCRQNFAFGDDGDADLTQRLNAAKPQPKTTS